MPMCLLSCKKLDVSHIPLGRLLNELIPSLFFPTYREGLRSLQPRSERQPQPMQLPSRSRSRSSSAIWASMRGRQELDSRSQSRCVGVRLSGSEASAERTSSSVSPTCWATRINDTRRMVARVYRRCPPGVRVAWMRPSAS